MQILPKIHQNGRSTKFFRNLVPAMWDGQWRYKGPVAWILAFLELKVWGRKCWNIERKLRSDMQIFQKFTKMVDGRNFQKPCSCHEGCIEKVQRPRSVNIGILWRLKVWGRKCWNIERKLRSGHANFSKKIHQNGRSTIISKPCSCHVGCTVKVQRPRSMNIGILGIKSVRKKVLKYRKKTKVRTCKFLQKFTKMVDRRNFSETLFLPRGMHREGAKAP